MSDEQQTFTPRTVSSATGTVADPAREAPSGATLAARTSSRLGRLEWIAGTAGALVVFNVIGFLIPIFLSERASVRSGLFNAPIAFVYVVASGLVTRRHLKYHLAGTLGWLVEGREPDAREHRRTLRIPLDLLKLNALQWTVAAVVFAAVNAIADSLVIAAVAGAAIWLGGETTCALSYLAAERISRPVTARALAARPAEKTVAPGVRARLVMAWLLGTGVPLLGLVVVGTVGVAKSGVDTRYVAGAVLFLGLVATAAGLLSTVFAARAIADPITSVRGGLQSIERGELDAHVAVDDSSEVGRLQAGFNRMAEGLRERERIRDLFGRQVGEEVARAALRQGVRLGGEEREVGALFVDLVGSSSMALAMPPTEVVRLLNRFFRVVVDVVEGQGGLVDKFEGDAALCVFGAPVPCEDPAGDALRTARALATRLSRELPEIDFGIGISAGPAVAGNIGAEHRFEYTVIGDPVNEAARLSELAKQRPERVLASRTALLKATEAESAAWTVTESAVLRGRTMETHIAHPRS